MSTQEVIKVLAVLKVAYPHSFKNMSNSDIEATVGLWTRQFESYDYEVVMAAVDALIATRTEGYTPTISEVKAQVHKITSPTELTDDEAWTLVLKAIKRGAYSAQEEWEKLPEAVRRCITPYHIHDMAISEDFNGSVESSNFKRTYRTKLESARQEAMLPQNVKNLISKSNVDRLGIEVQNER